tara:strand:+ start:22 stop:384 length:363 start_codon:yes stop_codon:yes gene_type:complete
MATMSGKGQKDLGALDGNWSVARAINDHTAVVGEADTGKGGSAFLWRTVHGMLNLNDLIPPNTGWHLITATDINNSGEIVGFGTFGSTETAYLALPISASTTEPPVVVMLLAGLLLVLAF